MRTTGMTEIRTLVSVAVPGDGAQKLTEAIVRATELAEEEAVTQLATKSDLAELKAATKSDFAELKANLAEMKADLVRWMFGAGITLTALIVGAVYFIVNLKH
jgi:MinD-like ATPase involved in chromosome partitioning or flagellar assembly